MDEFGRALLSQQEDRMTCSACGAQLAEYVDAQVTGIDLATDFAQIELHLQVCPHCAREYRELLTCVTVAYAEDPVRPARQPKFDFSFLETSQRSIWEPIVSAGEQIVRLFTEVPILIGRKMASFGPLPAPLAPAWATAPIVRGKPADAGESAQTLPLPSPEHDLALSLIIGPVSGNQAALSLQVTQISSGKPLSRARVTIRDKERRVLASDLTQEDGHATFPHLGSNSYLVETKYQGQVWELPIVFMLEQEAHSQP